MAYYRSFQQFSRLGWRNQIGLLLAVALGLAAAIALLVLFFSLAIIILPVAAIALLIGRWRLKRVLNEAQKRWEEQQQGRSGYIETEYSVVDDDDHRRR